MQGSPQDLEFFLPAYDPETTGEAEDSRLHLVTVCVGTDLRVVMGSPSNMAAPDVLVERGTASWRVFVHPNSGDPLCIVEFYADRATITDDEGNVLLDQQLCLEPGVSSGNASQQ